MTDYPLFGKAALVTGVSRRKGIGFGIARQLAQLGADIVIHHHAEYDAEQPWGGDDLELVRDGIKRAQPADTYFADHAADLSDPAECNELVDTAVTLTGRLDILVCNHAMDGNGSIFDMTAERLDACWRVNTRSTLLLTRRFAEQFAPVQDRQEARPGDRARPAMDLAEHETGRVIWLTSGQQDGPMRGEVAYATSKAALAGVTATVAAELLERGVILNTVNPGPVNTGYLDPETTDRDLTEVTALIENTPFKRFGAPDDPARLIGWLAGDAGRWMVGRVLATDGGFSLW